jgi:hypothetical protein
MLKITILLLVMLRCYDFAGFFSELILFIDQPGSSIFSDLFDFFLKTFTGLFAAFGKEKV